MFFVARRPEKFILLISVIIFLSNSKFYTRQTTVGNLDTHSNYCYLYSYTGVFVRTHYVFYVLHIYCFVFPIIIIIIIVIIFYHQQVVVIVTRYSCQQNHFLIFRRSCKNFIFCQRVRSYIVMRIITAIMNAIY